MTSPWIFRQKATIFSFKAEKLWNFVLKKKFFFQKVKGFYGRVECSFDNLAEVFWTQSWKLISQCPKMVWRFKTLFSSKLSSGHVGWSFDNPTEIFPTNGQKLIVQCPKVMKFSLKIVYSFKTFLLTSKIGFWWLRREFFDKKPQFSHSRPKNCETLFWKKSFFSKSERFLWTRRMQFWQSRWSFLDAELKTYLSMSENGMKIQNIIFLETLLWTRRMEFWQPDRNFSDEWSKTYHSMSESDEIFAQNSILFQNVRNNSKIGNWVLMTWPWIFRQKATIFSFKAEKLWNFVLKKSFVFKKWKVSMDA